MTRLEEFESLLSLVQSDMRTTQQHLPQIESFQGEFREICSRISNFENVLKVITENLEKLEEQVDQATTELGCNFGLRSFSLLKPLLGRGDKSEELCAPSFVPVPVFDSTDFFPDSTNCWSPDTCNGYVRCRSINYQQNPKTNPLKQRK